jgi:hypothetical protein
VKGYVVTVDDIEADDLGEAEGQLLGAGGGRATRHADYLVTRASAERGWDPNRGRLVCRHPAVRVPAQQPRGRADPRVGFTAQFVPAPWLAGRSCPIVAARSEPEGRAFDEDSEPSRRRPYAAWTSVLALAGVTAFACWTLATLLVGWQLGRQSRRR